MIRQWEQYAADVKKVKGEQVSIPDKVLSSMELVLDDDGKLRGVNRVHGENEVWEREYEVSEYEVLKFSQIAMVAWRMTFFTPHYPQGREVIVIGNDITHHIGSFGPQEDQLFKVNSIQDTSSSCPNTSIYGTII